MTVRIARLDSTAADFSERLERLLHYDVGDDSAVTQTAAAIIRDVRQRGDAAILEYTERFDGVRADALSGLALSAEDFERAFATLPAAERDALQLAAERIRDYHERQLESDWTYTDADGNRLGQLVRPLDRVGLYVPGGQAAYPSTVLMTAVPAKVAGVGELVMTVPTPGGERNPLVLAAAHVAGVDRGFAIGGAQAVAGLAYGSETLPRVDKIVGPGGAYVAAAKRLVFGATGIDMIAGPSEVLVIADGSTPVEWLVLDLFSQAEHDASAQALLVSPDPDCLDRVEACLAELLAQRSRAAIIEQSLGSRGGLIQVRNLDEAVAVSNRVAPEHLELAVADPEALLPAIRHAGAIFLGAQTPEVVGDYTAGPSHVLPTFGTARFSSPLGVYDFQKRSSLVQLSAGGSERLARAAAVLAHGEGLEAHARAAELRLQGLDHNRR